MEKLKRALDEVDAKVSSLRNRFEKLTKEAAELKIKLDKENETIEAAETLVTKLEGEYQRWSAQVSVISQGKGGGGRENGTIKAAETLVTKLRREYQRLANSLTCQRKAVVFCYQAKRGSTMLVLTGQFDLKFLVLGLKNQGMVVEG